MNETKMLVFGAVLGALYIVTGLLQVLGPVIGPVPGTDLLYLTGDLFVGFVLLVIGAVFAVGARNLSRDVGEGAIFISVGILLSVLFGLVSLLALCATGLDVFLLGEGAEWSVADSIDPLLYLAVIGAVGFLAWGRETLRGLTSS
ncbi:MAG: hypothetical protein KA818_06265 [Methanoculleus sp.]|jgi:hypothetical protein|nr:hypothetical protein [Methanoculleus sp.]